MSNGEKITYVCVEVVNVSPNSLYFLIMSCLDELQSTFSSAVCVRNLELESNVLGPQDYCLVDSCITLDMGPSASISQQKNEDNPIYLSKLFEGVKFNDIHRAAHRVFSTADFPVDSFLLHFHLGTN